MAINGANWISKGNIKVSFSGAEVRSVWLAIECKVPCDLMHVKNTARPGVLFWVNSTR